MPLSVLLCNFYAQSWNATSEWKPKSAVKHPTFFCLVTRIVSVKLSISYAFSIFKHFVLALQRAEYKYLWVNISLSWLSVVPGFVLHLALDFLSVIRFSWRRGTTRRCVKCKCVESFTAHKSLLNYSNALQTLQLLQVSAQTTGHSGKWRWVVKQQENVEYWKR